MELKLVAAMSISAYSTKEEVDVILANESLLETDPNYIEHKAELLISEQGYTRVAEVAFTLTGLFYAVYLNKQSNDIAISFRGTDEFVQDMVNNFFLSAFGFNYQSMQSIGSIGGILEKIIDDNKLVSPSFSFLGHSLGGFLASYVGDYVEFHTDIEVNSYAINAPINQRDIFGDEPEGDSSTIYYFSEPHTWDDFPEFFAEFIHDVPNGEDLPKNSVAFIVEGSSGHSVNDIHSELEKGNPTLTLESYVKNLALKFVSQYMINDVDTEKDISVSEIDSMRSYAIFNGANAIDFEEIFYSSVVDAVINSSTYFPDVSDSQVRLNVLALDMANLDFFLDSIIRASNSNATAIQAGFGNDTLKIFGSSIIFYAGDDPLGGDLDTVDYFASEKIDAKNYFSKNPLTTNDVTVTRLFEGQVTTDILYDIEKLVGSAFSDVFEVSTEEVRGGPGSDLFISKRDILQYEDYRQKLFGEGGDDTFKITSGSHDLIGGNGRNTVDYSEYVGSVTYFNTGATKTDNGGTFRDNLQGISQSFLTGQDDKFIMRAVQAGGFQVVSNLGAGNDIAETVVGAAKLNGGSGTDRISYAKMTEGIKINNTSARLISDADNNLAYDVFSNFEEIEATHQGDHINISGLNAKVWGLSGDDVIKVGGYGEFIFGGSGSDNITVDYGNGTENFIHGDSGNDIIVGSYNGIGASFFGFVFKTTISYKEDPDGIVADLSSTVEGTVQDGYGHTDTVSLIGGIIGSDHNDIIYADRSGNFGSADTQGISSEGGDDIIVTGIRTTVLSGDGNDLIVVNDGTFSADGGSGSNLSLILGGPGHVRSSTGEDVIFIDLNNTSGVSLDIGSEDYVVINGFDPFYGRVFVENHGSYTDVIFEKAMINSAAGEVYYVDLNRLRFTGASHQDVDVADFYFEPMAYAVALWAGPAEIKALL